MLRLPQDRFPFKTASALALTALLFAVLPLLPPARRFAGLHVSQLTSLGAVFHHFGPTWITAPASPAIEKATISPKAAPKVIASNSTPPVQASPYLFDPHHSLNHFFSALERTARKEADAQTLVLHYGDSPVTADSITADARSNLQARFGDAGHGFLLVAKPWAWYGHRGVELRGRGWKIEPATQARAHDGLHGLGGVSFTGGEGASSTVDLTTPQSHVEVEYLAQPNGGTFTLSADGQKLRDVSTEAATKSPGFAVFDLPIGTHRIELTVTTGTVRLFGYSFRNDQPGVIYSSLGLNGGQVQVVDRYFELSQWTAQLRHQKPDLLVLNYGTNESVFPEYIEKQYPKELHDLITRIQAALPETSILVMSPMDRGERNAAGEIVTPPILGRIVDIQKQTALDMGCAFFDTYDAMGGAGTMGRWYKAQPRLVSADFMHPLPGGAAKVGTLLSNALIKSFDLYHQSQELATSPSVTKPEIRNP